MFKKGIYYTFMENYDELTLYLDPQRETEPLAAAIDDIKSF